MILRAFTGWCAKHFGCPVGPAAERMCSRAGCSDVAQPGQKSGSRQGRRHTWALRTSRLLPGRLPLLLLLVLCMPLLLRWVCSVGCLLLLLLPVVAQEIQLQHSSVRFGRQSQNCRTLSLCQNSQGHPGQMHGLLWSSHLCTG